MLDIRQLCFGGFDPVDLLAETVAVTLVFAVPGDVLAGHAHAGVLAVKRVEVLQMSGKYAANLRRCRLRPGR